MYNIDNLQHFSPVNVYFKEKQIQWRALKWTSVHLHNLSTFLMARGSMSFNKLCFGSQAATASKIVSENIPRTNEKLINLKIDFTNIRMLKKVCFAKSNWIIRHKPSVGSLINSTLDIFFQVWMSRLLWRGITVCLWYEEHYSTMWENEV